MAKIVEQHPRLIELVPERLRAMEESGHPREHARRRPSGNTHRATTAL
jgi:hypothetical protein